MARILVVDDSRTLRALTTRLLTELNHDVVETSGGREALRALGDDSVDLVLLDIDMPEMTGYEVLAEIRATDQELPVIMLTARHDGRDIAQALTNGANDYLRKPCDQDELSARVDKALQHAEGLRNLETQVESLELTSRKDKLTGLGNRRDFDSRLLQLARSQGVGKWVNVAIADIDNFKKINDTYGHGVGDRVLAGLARVFEEEIPESAFVTRWGGEEFVIVESDLDISEAFHLMEHIRTAVHERPLMRERIVSVSIGLARGRLAGAAAIVETADEALYKAKENGRNRVEVARVK